MSDAAMIRAFVASMIEQVGGYDAAAAVISARLGHDISKGSISKRQSGQLDWPMIEVWALEDAVGDRRISNWRAQSDRHDDGAGEILDLIAEATRESGEALSALLQFASGRGCISEARKELEDAIATQKRLRAHLMAAERQPTLSEKSGGAA